MESVETNNSETQKDQEDKIRVQEKINQRREARRRKILENAKNRLERLNGRPNITTLNNSTFASTTTSDSLDKTYSHQHINGKCSTILVFHLIWL